MPSPSPAGPAPTSNFAKVLGIEAGAFQFPTDPPAPAGNLKAELDSFTTIDDCVDARARLDPLVGEAIEAIGYDTFLRDACRILDATKAREPKRCETIDASALRDRCRATVAQVTGDADACPWVAPDRSELGRDPECVAIASRDVRLCAAVTQSSAQAACRAITSHDEASCSKLSTRSEAARCARAADRWRAAVPTVSPDARVAFRSTGTLHVESIGAGSPVHVDVGLEPDARYGVVVTEGRNGAHLVFGPLSQSGADFIAPSPQVRPTIAFELFAPRGPSPAAPKRGPAPTDATRIESAELIVPGHPATATPVARSTLKAVLPDFEPARGAPLQMTIDGVLDDAVGGWRVHAEVATFVRDIVGPTASMGAPQPRPRDDPMARDLIGAAPDPDHDPAIAASAFPTRLRRPGALSADAPP